MPAAANTFAYIGHNCYPRQDPEQTLRLRSIWKNLNHVFDHRGLDVRLGVRVQKAQASLPCRSLVLVPTSESVMNIGSCCRRKAGRCKGRGPYSRRPCVALTIMPRQSDGRPHRKTGESRSASLPCSVLIAPSGCELLDLGRAKRGFFPATLWDASGPA